MTSIRWLTNCAFEIESDGRIITYDPCVRFMANESFSLSDYRKPDLVLVSHLHWDHISDIRYLYDTYRPLVMTGPMGRGELASYLDANQADIIPSHVNLDYDFGFCTVRPLFSVHKDVGMPLSRQIESAREKSDMIDSDMFSLQKTGSLEMTNYLITLKDSTRILIFGGELSAFQNKMLEGLEPDVAIMQYSYSQPDRYESLIQSIRPSVVIPSHHDFSKKEEVWRPLLKAFSEKAGKRFMIMDNNSTVVIR